MEIYCFSGTGNSLFAARKISSRFPGSCITPIVLNTDTPVITNADCIGFVFPIYVGNIPYPVRKFIENLNMNSAGYVFAIATYNNYLGASQTRMESLIRKKGKKLNSFFGVVMPNNNPTGIMPKFIPGYQRIVDNWVNEIKEDHINELLAPLEKKFDFIAGTVANRENFLAEASISGKISAGLQSLVENKRTEIPYYADETCTGCGICARVCPSGKISVEKGRPFWDKRTRCYYCYACFNFCPNQSLLLQDKYALKAGRYRNPSIVADDVAEMRCHSIHKT